MTQRRTWLLLTSGVTIFLAGCATVAGQGDVADQSLAAGPLSLQQQAAQVELNRIVVMFPPRRATLTKEDRRQLDLLARLIRDVDPVTLFATAYQTDTGNESGGSLSARRALAVKRGLVARGIPEWQLQVQVVRPPQGTDVPVEPADDGRVTITWGAS